MLSVPVGSLIVSIQIYTFLFSLCDFFAICFATFIYNFDALNKVRSPRPIPSFEPNLITSQLKCFTKFTDELKQNRTTTQSTKLRKNTLFPCFTGRMKFNSFLVEYHSELGRSMVSLRKVALRFVRFKLNHRSSFSNPPRNFCIFFLFLKLKSFRLCNLLRQCNLARYKWPSIN